MSKAKNNEYTIKSKPPITVFDHMDYPDIAKIVQTCITKNGKNLAYKWSNEDLFQESMLKLAMSKFDPVKSKPSTFIFMCLSSLFGSLWKKGWVMADRHKETHDRLLGVNDDGKEIRSTDIAEDHLTPEDQAIVAQYVNSLPLDEDGEVITPIEFNKRAFNLRAKRAKIAAECEVITKTCKRGHVYEMIVGKGIGCKECFGWNRKRWEETIKKEVKK